MAHHTIGRTWLFPRRRISHDRGRSTHSLELALELTLANHAGRASYQAPHAEILARMVDRRLAVAHLGDTYLEGAAMTAELIARALGGHANGDGWICRCPLPTHGKGKGDKHPSLSVRDGDTALVVNCFGNCDPLDVLDELRKRGLLEDRPEGKRQARRSLPAMSVPSEPEPNPKALRLWIGAQAITGSLGERYLREHRGITLPLPPSTRFTRTIYEKTGAELPCVAAAVQRPDRKIIAVQCTFLTEYGAKAPLSEPRWTYGALGTGAVRLAAACDVLGIAEGTEKALAAMQLSGVPCWSSIGAHRLASITIPDSVRELHIFADNDAPGRTAASRAADLHARAGRKVYLRFPPKGFKDYDQITQARTGTVAA
jgi:putative DNA primase/helicase